MSNSRSEACGAVHPMHGVSCQLAEGHAYGLLHRNDDGTGVTYEWQTPDLRIPMQRKGSGLSQEPRITSRYRP